MSGLRIICGAGLPARGAHAALVIRLSDVARSIGLTAVRVKASTFSRSQSRYLSFHDAIGNRWLVRVSDHYRPMRAQIPHLDFISRDGLAGFDEARNFLKRIAAGDIEWFDSDATFRPVASKHRRRIRA